MSAMLLRMHGIRKHFGGVYALRGVDFDLRAGEVHALLGENGAGKSTLMGILSGAVTPDRGEIAIDDAPVRFGSPREAQAAGIAMIPQELDLIPGLDIAANLFLGHEKLTPLGLLDSRSMLRAAQERLRVAGVALDAARPVAELRIGERQLVAIAKALSAAARILVMDEPTAALSAAEAEHLFGVVRELSGRGVGVIYISRRLEEVARVADRVTVLRDGAVVGETGADAPQAEPVRLLVGRRFEELFPPRAQSVGPELLRLDHARFIPRARRAGWQAPQDVSLVVHGGEIVGLAGLMGAGRTELLSALYGAGPRGRWTGQISISGRPAQLGSIATARRAGLALVTDDRRGSGLVLGQSVGWNIVMSTLRRLTPFGLISRPAEAAAVGVDVGAKSEIYHRLRALAEQGLGVLAASSELPELIGLCDRIIVLRGGVSVAAFAGGVDEAALRAASAGEAEAA